MSAEKTRAVIEQELGDTPIEDVFEWIELDSVLGSASIAQATPVPLVDTISPIPDPVALEN